MSAVGGCRGGGVPWVGECQRWGVAGVGECRGWGVSEVGESRGGGVAGGGGGGGGGLCHGTHPARVSGAPYPDRQFSCAIMKVPLSLEI